MDQEKVVKVLRSILLSCKSGMFIHDLVKEYRVEEATKIPFKTFGFDSFVDFLRTTGGFVVTETNDGLMVSAEQTANSEHVNDSVKGQNCSKKVRRKKRSKLQHPRTPLDIIYEDDHTMRYGIQLIRKQIQPRGHRRARVQCGPSSAQILQNNLIGSQHNSNRRVIGSARVQCGPLAQLRNSIGYQNNGSNNRNGQLVTVNETQNKQSLGTPTKPANSKLLKFSQALIRAMETQPDELMPKPKPKPKPFDFTELEAYRSAVEAIAVYCSKKHFPEPEYQFIALNTKKVLCSVIINEVRYGCYPHEYKTRDEAQSATATVALLDIKKIEESMKYPVCKGSPHDIAQQINACIARNGVFLDSLQTVFQFTYHQSLPDNWRLIVQNNTDLFELETNNFLGKIIIYPNMRDTRAATATTNIRSINYFAW